MKIRVHAFALVTIGGLAGIDERLAAENGNMLRLGTPFQQRHIGCAASDSVNNI